MGLGPHGSSLLARLGKVPGLTWPEPFSMQMEQIDRQEARRDAAIRHAMKHKTPAKPLAPVAPLPKVKGLPRRWEWTGESMPSKGLIQGLEYDTDVIREAGFKLPAIGGKKKCQS